MLPGLMSGQSFSKIDTEELARQAEIERRAKQKEAMARVGEMQMHANSGLTAPSEVPGYKDMSQLANLSQIRGLMHASPRPQEDKQSSVTPYTNMYLKSLMGV